MSLSKKTSPKLKFLLDENVDVRLASFLERRGFSVLFPSKGLKNGAVASLAKKESSVLLTNDRDFANTDLFKPSEFAGIVVFAIHPPLLSKLESTLLRLFEEFSPEEFSGKIFLLSESGVEVKE